MDDLVADFRVHCCMERTPSPANHNCQVDSDVIMGDISTINPCNVSPQSSEAVLTAHKTDHALYEAWNRPWTITQEEEKEILQDDFAKFPLLESNTNKQSDFSILSDDHRQIIHKELMILERLEFMRDGAKHVFRVFEEAKEDLPKFLNTLIETYNTWLHLYNTSSNQLTPDIPDELRVQHAIERLFKVERWSREATSWVNDACPRLKAYHRLYQELASSHEARYQTIKAQFLREHRARMHGLPWSSRDLDEMTPVAIGEDKLKHRFPHVTKMYGPCSDEEYEDWPADEMHIIEPAVDIYEAIMERAKVWGLFERNN